MTPIPTGVKTDKDNEVYIPLHQKGEQFINGSS